MNAAASGTRKLFIIRYERRMIAMMIAQKR
jgi:hypothetical protein